MCCNRLSSPCCRSELIDSAWVVILPGQKMHTKNKTKQNNPSLIPLNFHGLDGREKALPRKIFDVAELEDL